jgi:hypothetical protein
MRLSIRAIVLSLLCLALLPTIASAQALTDACKPAGGPFTTTAGKSIAVTWVQPAPLGTIDGFSYVFDGGARVDFDPTASGVATPCDASSSQPAATPYLYNVPGVVAQGSHTIRLIAYMFKRTTDATGNLVIDKTVRQEFPSTDVPFVAVAALPPSPSKPKNIKVWKK